MPMRCPSILPPQISPVRMSLIFLFIISPPTYAGTNTTSDRYELYSSFDPSMAIVIMVLIGVFFFIGFFSVVLRNCSEQPSIIVSASLRPKQGLDPTIRSSFPTFLYSEIKNIKLGIETLECAICLSEFLNEESLKLLPKCSHVFHPECIDKWLLCHVTCPVCRAQLNSPVHHAVTVNESPVQQNDVVISVNDEPRREVSGKFPRSHSTGHSLVRLELSNERFTLRLPEEIRRQIMESAKLKRTRSFDVVSSGEGSSKGKLFFGWSDLLRNQPFGFRGSGSGSVRPNKGVEDGDSVNGRSRLGAVSVKVPLNCFEGSGK